MSSRVATASAAPKPRVASTQRCTRFVAPTIQRNSPTAQRIVHIALAASAWLGHGKTHPTHLSSSLFHFIRSRRWMGLDPFTKVAFKQRLAYAAMNDPFLHSAFSAYNLRSFIAVNKRKMLYLSTKISCSNGMSFQTSFGDYDDLARHIWNTLVHTPSKQPKCTCHRIP